MQTWWCDEHKDVYSSNNNCAWKPDQLGLLARQQDFMDANYNEIVINPQALVHHLPHSVLGVFFHSAGGDWARVESASVHARFLADYHLSAARFPLLEYHEPPKGQGVPYFSCAVCA